MTVKLNRGDLFMVEVFCGWVCSDCSLKYNLEEERVLPLGYVQWCENCSKEFIGKEVELKQLTFFDIL